MGTYHVIGVMSGSSLDGLDIAYCVITEENGHWSYKIEKAECIPFQPKWKLRIEKLVLQNAITYIKTHTFLGHYMGEQIRQFIERHDLDDKLDFIASHGQTVFHQPENNFTSQIGDGAAIARRTGHTTVCDFRTTDIAYGGHGTPIAPMVDKMLFPNYKLLLNLGGISNLTVNHNERCIAFDITTVNMIMNRIAQKVGKDYDKDGDLARAGKVNEQLFEDLNGSWYYGKEYPKSLSGGWVSKVIYPTVNKKQISIEDKLRTLVQHIVHQHKLALDMVSTKEGIELSKGIKMLVTGGGAFNRFLVEQMDEQLPVTVVIPNESTVKFKEALLMALMGVLRVRHEVNCMSTVTGAEQDTIGGAIYLGNRNKLKTLLG